MERDRKLPLRSTIYFCLAVFFMVLPIVAPYYKGASGRALVAMPSFEAPLWKHAVLYIMSDGWEGTKAVIINRELTGAEKSRAPTYLLSKNIPLYYGGPVGFPDTVFILEKQETQTIVTPFEELQAGNKNILNDISKSIQSGDNRYRVIIGYAGWHPFQMRWEKMRHEVWGITDFNPLWIGMPPETAWQDAFGKIAAELPSKMPRRI